MIVVGSGPAGLAAAWEAREAGAEVLVLEMDLRAGGSGRYAGHLFGAGTSYQAELGIEDSVDRALDEWPQITGGGDADDPAVVDFVQESGATVEWLARTTGLSVRAVMHNPAAGQVERVHVLEPAEGGATAALAGILEEETRLETRVEALLTDGGAVAGVRALDLASGREEDLTASAVVMATGGYARDEARLAADRPALAGLVVVPEVPRSATGAGHDLLDDMGAAWQNPGRYGLYVHSTRDWRPELEEEALWLPHLTRALIVDLEGRRVANEHETMGFQLAQVLMDSPQGRLVALFDEVTFRGMPVMVPGYNWAVDGFPELVPSEDLLDAGAAVRLEGFEAVAGHFGFDAEVFEATVGRYESFLDQGEDLDFGKPVDDITRFQGLFYAVEIYLGATKAFGGVDTDPRARVLGEHGAPIPGLFAAGEVSGMLGTPAVGEGFSGSISAVLHHGRIAGREAAAHALDAR